LVLAEALEFLHQQGLTHRDIKPQNIIFANGQPKLADIGLIAEIRPADADGTYLGTPGYMPPPPEMPGTPQADIYALGMVLYTISTGSNPAYFPDLATTLVDPHGHREFLVLNTLILKACQPDCARRYASAAEMQAALKAALQALEQDVPSPKD
jgi:serine/threonine protein kinase